MTAPCQFWLQNPAETWLAGAHLAHSGPLISSLAPWKIAVYVHHDFLRQGIGSRLLTELIAAARRIGLRSILANISADQTPSIRLHEKFGFQKVAHLRQVGQKFNKWFDAVYMQLLLSANKHLQPTPR
jgi:RimJ/RimL family protein N-acetyltransferase